MYFVVFHSFFKICIDFVLLLYIGILYERTVKVLNYLHILIITFPLFMTMYFLLFTLKKLI